MRETTTALGILSQVVLSSLALSIIRKHRTGESVVHLGGLQFKQHTSPVRPCHYKLEPFNEQLSIILFTASLS